MPGLSATNARLLPEEQHLAQSINDILATPLGSRVMRRDYGSDLPRLIDAPLNGETLVDLFAATAEAIDRWEPRFDLRRVEVADAVAGRLSLTRTGEVLGLETVLAAEVAA
jgi:phage baseplate assembly protein W